MRRADSSLFCVATTKHAIELYDVASLGARGSLPGHREPIVKMVDADAGLVTLCRGNVVKIWDVQSRQLRATHQMDEGQLVIEIDSSLAIWGPRIDQLSLIDADRPTRRHALRLAFPEGWWATSREQLANWHRVGQTLVVSKRSEDQSSDHLVRFALPERWCGQVVSFEEEQAGSRWVTEHYVLRSDESGASQLVDLQDSTRSVDISAAVTGTILRARTDRGICLLQDEAPGTQVWDLRGPPRRLGRLIHLSEMPQLSFVIFQDHLIFAHPCHTIEAWPLSGAPKKSVDWSIHPIEVTQLHCQGNALVAEGEMGAAVVDIRTPQIQFNFFPRCLRPPPDFGRPATQGKFLGRAAGEPLSMLCSAAQGSPEAPATYLLSISHSDPLKKSRSSVLADRLLQLLNQTRLDAKLSSQMMARIRSLAGPAPLDSAIGAGAAATAMCAPLAFVGRNGLQLFVLHSMLSLLLMNALGAAAQNLHNKRNHITESACLAGAFLVSLQAQPGLVLGHIIIGSCGCLGALVGAACGVLRTSAANAARYLASHLFP